MDFPLPLLLHIGIILLITLFSLGLVLRFRRHGNAKFSDLLNILWLSVTTTATITSSVSAFYFAWTGELYPGQTLADLRWQLAVISVLMPAGGLYFYVTRIRDES